MEQGTLKNNNHIVVIARECDNILFLDLFVDLPPGGVLSSHDLLSHHPWSLVK